MAESAESTIMNQEVPQDISKSLDFYRNRFNHKYKPNLDEIVDLESQYEKFYESVQQVVMSKQNQIYLFFGLEGNGKKTVVDYCVQRLQANSTRVLNIVVDARVYKTEKLFLEEFYRKLVKLEECDERIAMYYKGQNFLFSEIDSVIKDIKTFIIITVKNLCDLSKNTRQVLLYSLLDWIRTSNVRIVIVGLVQDLMFLDLLEKRVKSRLSFMSFNFFKYSFEELKQVIIRRIQSNPQDPSLNKKLVEAIDYKETQDFLRPFYLGQRTIEWFISLFNLYFCLQNGLELENTDNVQPILLQGLKNVVNMLEPEYHKELLGDLVHSAELIIMVVLKRLIEQARSPLNFMVILDEIKDLKRRTSNITAFNFSDKVLLKAYENLTNINFIKLEGNNEKGNKLENFDCVLNVHLDDLKDFIRENSANMPSFVVEWSRG